MHLLAALLSLPTVALAASACASGDNLCGFTSEGWAPSAASYLVAAEPTIEALLGDIVAGAASAVLASGLALLSTNTPAAQSYLSEYSAQQSTATGLADVGVLATYAPAEESNAAAFSSIFTHAVSLNGGTTPGVTGGAASQPSGQASSQGASLASSSSHAVAAAGSKPTDMAVMAMSGVAAGVIGLVFGL